MPVRGTKPEGITGKSLSLKGFVLCGRGSERVEAPSLSGPQRLLGATFAVVSAPASKPFGRTHGLRTALEQTAAEKEMTARDFRLWKSVSRVLIRFDTA